MVARKKSTKSDMASLQASTYIHFEIATAHRQYRFRRRSRTHHPVLNFVIEMY